MWTKRTNYTTTQEKLEKLPKDLYKSHSQYINVGRALLDISVYLLYLSASYYFRVFEQSEMRWDGNLCLLYFELHKCTLLSFFRTLTISVALDITTINDWLYKATLIFYQHFILVSKHVVLSWSCNFQTQ